MQQGSTERVWGYCRIALEALTRRKDCALAAANRRPRRSAKRLSTLDQRSRDIDPYDTFPFSGPNGARPYN
jgi:hypothetical protein